MSRLLRVHRSPQEVNLHEYQAGDPQVQPRLGRSRELRPGPLVGRVRPTSGLSRDRLHLHRVALAADNQAFSLSPAISRRNPTWTPHTPNRWSNTPRLFVLPMASCTSTTAVWPTRSPTRTEPYC